jgi:hypothetical protein
MKNSALPPRQSAVGALRLRLTWSTLALAASGLLWQTAQAQFALPVYEPFPSYYTNTGLPNTITGVDWPGTGLRQSGIPSTLVWTWGGTGNGNPTNAGGAALTYTGLYQTNGSVGLYMSDYNITGGRSATIPLATVSSGKFYTSFLLNVQAWPTNVNRPVVLLSSSTTLGGSDEVGFFMSTTNWPTAGTTNRIYVIKRGTYAYMALSNIPPAAPSIEAGSTHLVVIRYTFNPAQTNDDELALWVDPGSLAVAEGSVPAPATTTTDGDDITAFSAFGLFQQNAATVAGSRMFIDEIRVGTTWADVTPTTAPCNKAFITSNPTNLSLVEGAMATFTTVGGGSDATFQWQVSTDGGGTWTPLAQGFGTNGPSFSIPSVVMSQNGNQYRCQIVATGCGNTTTNSTAATLTVTAPVVTPPGVLVDDFFMKRDRLSGPVNSTNSQWFTDVSASLVANAEPDPVMLVGKPQDGGSCVWLGYFVESNAPPVHLDIGRVLKASLVFTSQGTQSGTTNGLRVGLYDHYDAGIRLSADGTVVRNSGANVRGYMAFQDWETVFNADQPQSLSARNNMADPSLMGTAGDYETLAHSAEGFLNAPAFSDGTPYTMDFYVARMTAGRCSVCISLTGGGTNYTTVAADRDYGYHRFDCVAIRPASLQATATEFDISEFKVQVLPMPDRPTVNIAPAGQNVILSWTNPAIYMPFQLQQASAATGPWSIIPGGDVSPYTTGVTNAATFYRLEWP